MALSDRYTLAQLRTLVRAELMDLSTNTSLQYWPDGELNRYCQEWQSHLQSMFEFVWTTATATPSTFGGGTNVQWDVFRFDEAQFDQIGNVTTLSTIVLSNLFPDLLRLDAVYFSLGGTSTSTYRIIPQTVEDLDTLKRDWRLDDIAEQPIALYQENIQTVGFWPSVVNEGTFVFEYPKLLTLTTDTSTMALPAWVRYDVVPFCLYKALTRFGPNQNINRANLYLQQHQQNLTLYRDMYHRYFPKHSQTLRPVRKWGSQLLNPPRRLKQ